MLWSPLTLLLGATLGSPPGSPAPTAPASDPSSPVSAGPRTQPGSPCGVVWVARVVDEDTGEGVPNAVIELRTGSDPAPSYARTDEQGGARVEGLCEGPLRVSVVKVEHSRTSLMVELVGPEHATTIELEALHEHHSEHVIVIHDEGRERMAASEHLAGAELAETRGQGLADAISGVSGVTTLRGTAGGMAKPVIRGQIGRRNLIVFDGIRHEGQKWGLDHAPEIDPYAAGRITVIKGAATTRFGPDAIGGVVLVDPRPLLRAPGLSGELSALGGSNPLGGGGALRLDYAPARARGLAWRVEGNASRQRATLTPDYPLDNTGALSWNAGARLGYLSERFDVVVGYRILRTLAGICTCLRVSTSEEFEAGIGASQPINADLYSAEFGVERPRQQVWHHLAMARARVELGRAGELHGTYAFQLNDRQEFERARQSVSGPQLSFALATHTGELRYEHGRVDLGRGWALIGTLGASAAHQSNDFEAATTLIPDYEQSTGGVFAVEQFVGQRVEVEVGGRYEGLARTARLSERDLLGQRAGGRLDESACVEADNPSEGARCKKVFHTPSATAGVLTRPIERVPELSWRLDVNSSARIPAIDEQYMNGAAPSFPILGVGDSRMGIERTWGSTTTLRYEGDWLLVEGSAYVNYVDDYIYFSPEPQVGQCAPLTCTTRGPFPVFAFAPIDALFGGGELRFDLVAPRLPFELSGDASWVRAADLSDGGFVNFVPADRYGLKGRYVWPDTRASSRGYVEIGGIFVAQQRRHEPRTDFAAPPPAYVLLGAGVGVEFPGDAYLMRLSLRGTNLLNRRYREYTSLLRYFADEPGWGLQLRYAVEFDARLHR